MFHALMQNLIYFCLIWKFFASSHSFFGNLRKVFRLPVFSACASEIKFFLRRHLVEDVTHGNCLLKERIMMSLKHWTGHAMWP